EIADAQVIEVIAFRIPRGLPSIEKVAGHTVHLAVRDVPDVDGTKIIGIIHDKSQVAAILRPGVVVDPIARVLRYLRELLVIEREDIELSVFVAEGDALSIGRPFRRVEHGFQTMREFLRLSRTVLA